MYVICLLFYAIGDFCFSIFLCFYIFLAPFSKYTEAPLGEGRYVIVVYSIPLLMVRYFCMLPVVRYCYDTWQLPSA